MRIGHKLNHGWLPEVRNDPEWERRVEREAAHVTAAAERAYAVAQRRLAKAEERLTASARIKGIPRKRLAELERQVAQRREDLLHLARLMRANPAPTTARGRKSYRGINVSEPL